MLYHLSYSAMAGGSRTRDHQEIYQDRRTMSTPTPETTAADVAAEVHQVLDTAKSDVSVAVAAAEHLHFGDLATEVKHVVHDGIELLKQKVAELLHHVPTQAPPTS